MVKPEPGGLGQPPADRRDAAHVAGQRHLADRAHRRRHGELAAGRGQRERDAEVGGRFGAPRCRRRSRRRRRGRRAAAGCAGRGRRAASPPGRSPGRSPRGGATPPVRARFTSACTSVTSGRRPSMVTSRRCRARRPLRSDRNSPDGSLSPTMPSSRISKQPTSSAAPYRFFVARTSRSAECRSPSKCSTTSTRCSSTRGPAIAPSLVTWPTRTVAMPRSLATPISAAATARICGTPPAPLSTASVEIVCTESTTSRPGPDVLRRG